MAEQNSSATLQLDFASAWAYPAMCFQISRKVAFNEVALRTADSPGTLSPTVLESSRIQQENIPILELYISKTYYDCRVIQLIPYVAAY